MSQRIARRTVAGLALCLVIGAGPARAQIPGWDGEDPKPAPPSAEQIALEAQKKALQAKQRALQNELSAAWADTKDVAAHGPATVKLGESATFTVPENYIYVPVPQGTRILRAYGTTSDANVIGIVVSTGQNQHWMAAIRHRKDGHISDAQAATWSAEDQLVRLREVTADANQILASRNEALREVVGWIVPPQYDAKQNVLRWSINSRPKNEIENGNNVVIYNTARLGRDGYYSVALTSNLNQVKTDKVAADTIISNIAFNPGRTYADFAPGRDPVASYTISTLAELAPERDTSLVGVVTEAWASHWKILLTVLALTFVGLGVALRLRRTRPTVDA